MDSSSRLLSTRGVAKNYGAVTALRSVDLTVGAGEVHGLMGANGAGKSTMVKILTGVIRPTAGSIEVNGRAVTFRNPLQAQQLGLASVFQDPALVPDLSVLENLRLTRADPDVVRRHLAGMDLGGLDLSSPVRDIALPMLRMIDLARALSRDPYLLLLDEITAALPADLAERVIAVMRSLKERGRSVLFISHRLSEVQAHCDRCTVLRDGTDVDSFAMAEGGEARIVAAMLGDAARRVRDDRTGRAAFDDTAREVVPAALEVEQLATAKLRALGFSVRAGEVLGIAALEGQGQDQLFSVLSGDTRPRSGEIRVRGRALSARHPADAIAQGVVLIPSDRLLALLPQRPVRENLAVPLFRRTRKWGVIPGRRHSPVVDAAIERLQIDTRAQSQVKRLSGGNQQKVTIGRWLTGSFDVMLCFDPTRGIDVGTKHQIYELVRELASTGKAVLFFTSELREIPMVCDRTIVLYDGRIVTEFTREEADEERLIQAAHGIVANQPAGAAS